jgi:CubicO group peptidase (beta-lactamase class C family)
MPLDVAQSVGLRVAFELSLGDTMASITRRAVIAKLLPGFALSIPGLRVYPWLQPRAGGDGAIGPGGQDDLKKLAQLFCQKFDVPGLSVAIHRYGQSLYEEAFGEADARTHEPLNISHRFRIASISKPITSVAILKLAENNHLRLSDRVFGEASLLGTEYGPPKDSRVHDITVEQLLTHTAGGWSNKENDPMFRFRELSAKELMALTIRNVMLDSKPGTRWDYSNFGFCILGRVIEKITNQKYADHVQDQVLSPSGITGMRIGGNTPAERLPMEVVYYGQSAENPYNCNVTRMDSHGGWVATARELAIFAAHIDGSDQSPGLLQPRTIASMVALAYPNNSSPDSQYAKGWFVSRSDSKDWFHDGSLQGTSTILERTSEGFCWSGLTNTRRQPSAEIAAELRSTLRRMVSRVVG